MASEDLAREIGRHLAPVYAADRSGDLSAYTVRLVLTDLRRIDISATTPAGVEQSPAAAQNQSPPDPIAELIGTFKFDAVLAAVKAARHDVLISAHLTLQRPGPQPRRCDRRPPARAMTELTGRLRRRAGPGRRRGLHHVLGGGRRPAPHRPRGRQARRRHLRTRHRDGAWAPRPCWLV
jgi:hypothetical protein